MQQILPFIEKESLRLVEQFEQTGIICAYSYEKKKVVSLDRYLTSLVDIKTLISR